MDNPIQIQKELILTSVKLVEDEKPDIFLELYFDTDSLRFQIPKNIVDGALGILKELISNNKNIIIVASGYNEIGYYWFFDDLIELCSAAAMIINLRILEKHKIQKRFLSAPDGPELYHDMTCLKFIQRYAKNHAIDIHGNPDFWVNDVPVEVKTIQTNRVDLPVRGVYEEINTRIKIDLCNLFKKIETERNNSLVQLEKAGEVGAIILSIWDRNVRTFLPRALDFLIMDGLVENIENKLKSGATILHTVDAIQDRDNFFLIPKGAILSSILLEGNVLGHLYRTLLLKSKTDKEVCYLIPINPRKSLIIVNSKRKIPFVSISINGKDEIIEECGDKKIIGTPIVYAFKISRDLYNNMERNLHAYIQYNQNIQYPKN
jgi:hypothetical protein